MIFKYHNNLTKEQLEQLEKDEKILIALGDRVILNIGNKDIDTIRDLLRQAERAASRIYMASE